MIIYIDYIQFVSEKQIMSGLSLQLKCHQLIIEINDITLNNNILKLVNELGGIRELLLSKLNTISCNNLVNLLKNIKENEDNVGANEGKTMTITSLPKDMILEISHYLNINEIKSLGMTCIDLVLACKSEINKIDIRIITYNDLILDDTLVLEKNDLDMYGKMFRVDNSLKLGNAIMKHLKLKEKALLLFWNPISMVNDSFPVENIKSFHDEGFNVRLNKIFIYNLKFCVFEHSKCISMINHNDDRLILIKYFDIPNQKLYILDVIRIQRYNLLTHEMISNHIKKHLIPKYKHLFTPILRHIKDMLTPSNNIFKFYQQKPGFEPNDIQEIFSYGNTLSQNVVLFELDICGNETNKLRFINQIQTWKQKLKKQNKPFCSNVITFWSYNYAMYKTKKALLLS